MPKQRFAGLSMSFRKIESAFVKHDKDRIHQGDILKDVTIKQVVSPAGDAELIDLRFLFILSQECDLLWDNENREELKILSEIDILENESSLVQDKPDKLENIFSDLVKIKERLDLEKFKLSESDFSLSDKQEKNSQIYLNKISSIVKKLREKINADKRIGVHPCLCTMS